MIRQEYIIEDVQRCIFRMLYELSGEPWDSWDVILNYPDSDVFEHFTKGIIYVSPPVLIDKRQSQGTMSAFLFDMVIGTWNDFNTGGEGEINIVNSKLIELFSNPQKVHKDKTFDVTLGTTTYSGTNLTTMGVEIGGVSGFRKLTSLTDLKEFRYEMNLEIIT